MQIKIALCDDDVNALPIIAGAADSAFRAREIRPEIIRFTSGRDLLASMEKTRYQIVLLDIEMPDMDGIAVGKVIRDRGDNTPIIFVSECESRVFESFLIQPLVTSVPPNLLLISLDHLFQPGKPLVLSD